MAEQPEDEGPAPLSFLPENEAQIMEGVLRILQAGIADQELRDDIIGAIIYETEEWAVDVPKVQSQQLQLSTFEEASRLCAIQIFDSVQSSRHLTKCDDTGLVILDLHHWRASLCNLPCTICSRQGQLEPVGDALHAIINGDASHSGAFPKRL